MRLPRIHTLALGLLIAGPGLFCLAARLPAETVRILALRVDFSLDSLNTTSGDGSFGSAFRFRRNWAIDPLPHDSLYFDSQLRFLEHYYSRASNGELNLEWEIWPPGENAAYRLPHPMWHYHWNLDEAHTDEQLAQLFHDALATADQDPRLLFHEAGGAPRFDAFIIFHAGVGQDFGEDATPHDIPSAFLSAPLAGEPSPQDVTVLDEDSGRSLLIRQGLILPEGQNHENFQHALAGSVVLQFGHQLGLPNLYNGETGVSVIGKWGLMDQGSANFRGLLPAPLDAWTRLLKGWDEAEEVAIGEARTELRIKAPGVAGDATRIVKIPLSDSEHLLVENRLRQDENLDWTWGRDRDGNWARLDNYYELSFQDPSGTPGDSAGVLVEVGNLDFDLPGSGLLVWHVDGRRTTPLHVAGNSVNNDPDLLGVDLEEGDGVQDIGQEYGLFSSRSAVSLGGDEDPWQQPSRGWAMVNSHYSYNNVSLAWDTEPSTASNDGLFTGLRLDGFGAPDSLGRLNVSWDLRPPSHGLALAPPLSAPESQDARVQAFVWPADGDSLAAVLSLVDGSGRNFALGLAGDVQLWPRVDGFQSLLPPDWQDSLGGMWQLDQDGEARLLAQKADSLFLFRPVGMPRRMVLEATWSLGQAIQGVLASGGDTGTSIEDPWADRSPRLHVVAGSVLFELDAGTLAISDTLAQLPPGDLQLVELADGAFPGVLIRGDFPRLILGGRLVISATADMPHDAVLLACDALPEVSHMPLSGTVDVATALLRDSQGASLYSADSLLRRIDCPNTSLRPAQFGPDPGLELVFQLPDGGLRVYNQAGVRIADLSLETGHSVPLTGSRSDAGGLAILAAGSGRLSGLDGTGIAPATWPRWLAPHVDGPVALPELGQVLTVGLDGRVSAWEAELQDAVWTQPRGGANGGARPWGSGLAHAEAVRQVRDNAVFIWPNPAQDEAHVRFWLDGPSRVTVSIYDTAGDRVAQLAGEFDRQGEHELLWNLRTVAPGAYFALVEAQGRAGGGTWSRQVKCAVIR